MRSIAERVTVYAASGAAATFRQPWAKELARRLTTQALADDLQPSKKDRLHAWLTDAADSIDEDLAVDDAEADESRHELEVFQASRSELGDRDVVNLETTYSRRLIEHDEPFAPPFGQKREFGRHGVDVDFVLIVELGAGPELLIDSLRQRIVLSEEDVALHRHHDLDGPP